MDVAMIYLDESIETLIKHLRAIQNAQGVTVTLSDTGGYIKGDDVYSVEVVRDVWESSVGNTDSLYSDVKECLKEVVEVIIDDLKGR